MFELSLNRIDKYMGTNLVLKDVNINIFQNDRVGIVGANGSGKTTILKLIAGIVKLKLFSGSWSPGYDYGWISLPREATVAYLDQIPDYDEDYKVIDVLNLAFKEVFTLENEMRSLENEMAISSEDCLEKVMKKYERTSQLYEIKGGYDIQEKLGRVCTGLGFDEKFLEKPFSQLSGGEKTTVELGKLLVHEPDILLLDEPTNHLDTEAIEWLEKYLLSYKGIIVTVSHDRYFLDSITTKIVEIEDLTTKTYKGNYSSFVAQKEEAMRIQFADFKEQKKKIQAMEKQITELRSWALKADNNKFFKRAASIQIKLNKMEKIKKPVFERSNMKLNLKSESRSGDETIVGYDIGKKYDNQLIFKDASMMIRYSERIGLIGANGSGKSTLIKMLLEEERLDSGVLKLGSNTKVGYLPQTIKFKNEIHSVLECFRDEVVIEEGKAREYLAKYMFYGKSVFTEVGALSGGERIRLMLAKLLYTDVNLLILDEPTNHLDIDSIETFEGALEDFTGTLLFVSHDRYFINKVSEGLLAIEDHQLIRHDGDYDSYRASRTTETVTPKTKKVKIRHEEIRDMSSEKIENQIADLENRLEIIKSDMENHCTDYEMLNSLYSEKEMIVNDIESLWQVYEKLS